MAQDSTEIQAVPRRRSPSIWSVGHAFGTWKNALISQRRQSTKLITDMVHGFDQVLDGDDNVLGTTLHWFEKATTINRRYLLLGALLFAISYLSMGRSAATLCNVLGMVYPIYASIKAVESLSGHTKEHWLMYWIVYNTISFLELTLEIFLVWLPMYYLLKFLFLSWCMMPFSANGSNVIYAYMIRPLFQQHSDAVESALSAMAEHFTNASTEILKQVPKQPESGDQAIRHRQGSMQQD